MFLGTVCPWLALSVGEPWPGGAVAKQANGDFISLPRSPEPQLFTTNHRAVELEHGLRPFRDLRVLTREKHRVTEDDGAGGRRPWVRSLPSGLTSSSRPHTALLHHFVRQREEEPPGGAQLWEWRLGSGRAGHSGRGRGLPGPEFWTVQKEGGAEDQDLSLSVS